MNKSKIEWCDCTWNPVTGCRHGCSYCYARRIAHRFPANYTPPGGAPFDPMIHVERLSEPYRVKKPSRIFVCSMADLFGEWVPVTWIRKVIDVAEEYPRHTFMFLTKNPGRYREFNWTDNCWLGATVTDKASYERANNWFSHIVQPLIKTFISIEPWLVDFDLVKDKHCGFYPDWIVIGAMTGQRMPNKYWDDLELFVRDAIEICGERDIPLFLKDNLHWPVKIQEFPQGKEF